MKDYKITFLRGLYGHRIYIEYFKALNINELYSNVYKKYGEDLKVDKIRIINLIEV